MFWNKLNAIHDEVHKNTVDIAVVKTNLENHLKEKDKNVNRKLTLFAVLMGSGVGLLAIFI